MKFGVIIYLSLVIGVVAFAQTVTPAPSDTVAIVVTVRMIGASWTIDTLADGWDSAGDTIVGQWRFDSGVAYDSFYASGEDFDICERMVAAYWLENLGGITLDLEFKVNIGPDWMLVPDAYDCTRISALYPDVPDIFGMNIILMRASGLSDGHYDHHYLDSHNIPLPLNAWREADSLRYCPSDYAHAYQTITSTGTGFIAEDPVSLGDGVFGTQRDQAELFVYLMTPYLPASAETQVIKVWVRAKICD